MSKRCLAAAVAVVGIVASASAQDYPSRPLTMIVPYPAGGVTDALARLFAERMKTALGQTITIENVGGAAGSIGVGRAVRALPDGYTFLMGNTETNVVTGAALTLSYDVINDLDPVALLPSYPFLIVTKNSVPAKDLKELIGWLKANGDKVTQGTVGAGTVQHFCGLFMQGQIGARWQFVPYRGGAPAMQDLIAGQFDLMCTATGSFLPLVRSGQIRAYAVTANTRLAAAPDIPTVDEAGLPGIYVSVWNGLWAPKGTPRYAIAKLNAAALDALSDPALRQRVIDMGLDLPPPGQQTPEALGAYQKAEAEKWWPIARAANIKAE